jgi:hypothetical protein
MHQSREAHRTARPHHSPEGPPAGGCRVMAQPEHVEQDENPAAGLIGWEGIADSAAGPAQCGAGDRRSGMRVGVAGFAGSAVQGR